MLERIFLKDNRLRPTLRVLVYAVAVFFVWLLVAVTIGNVYALFKGPEAAFIDTPPWIVYAGLVVSTVSVAFLLRTTIDRRSIDSLGLTFRTQWLRLLLLGILLGAGMQLLIFAIELISGGTHVAGFEFSARGVAGIATGAALFFVAALAEEMPFRGYTLQNLWEEAGFWPAAIITSLLFALVHASNPHFAEHRWVAWLNIAGDGLWACVSVLWTRSLWLAWGQHFAWNLFEGPILGAPVSGYSFPSALAQTATTPNIFFGGAFGPEGGLAGSIALAAGFAVLWWLQKRGAFAHLPDTREAYARGRINSAAT